MIDAVRTATRPRIEGERESAIFDATMRLLATCGYDRLTMDAVAAEARASKATLYRRWTDKSRPGRRRPGLAEELHAGRHP